MFYFILIAVGKSNIVQSDVKEGSRAPTQFWVEIYGIFLG